GDVATHSSGSGYLQREPIVGPSSRHLSEAGSPAGSRAARDVLLPSVPGQLDPLARLVVEAPHAARLVEGVEQDLANVDRRGDLHELRLVHVLVAHLDSCVAPGRATGSVS